MSKSTSVLFKKSLIAAAVLSLSACSSTPRIGDYDLGRVGEGIANAGRTTADVSGRVWNKTTYLLGFTDDDGETVSDEGLLMDAEDVALLDGESSTVTDTVVRPIVIRSAVPNSQDQTPMNAELNDQVQTPTDIEQPLDTATITAQRLEQNGQTPTTAQLSDAAASEPMLQQDLVHEVAATETLWDIAKKTTGDANNWHILADTNNLGPGASVYPGQELIIPRDMVKPGYGAESDAAITATATTDLYVDTQNLTGASDNPVAPVDDVLADAGSKAVEQEITGKPFKVNPGETLWDFSKRITGDATNWQAIAGENRFTDEQASYVRTGQTIYVPEALIKPELGSANSLEESASDSAQLVQPTPESELSTAATSTEVAATTPSEENDEELAITVITSASAAARHNNDSTAINASSDALSDASDILDETQPIKIVEATFKSSKSPASLSTADNDTAEALAVSGKNGKSPAQIMVSGTYYPKAVYNEADFSSSLLMRVSPGTTLQVSKSMGSWFQVKTEKGLGYVHQRDIK